MLVLATDRGGHVGRARLPPLSRGRGGDGIQSVTWPTGRRGERAPRAGNGGVGMQMRMRTVTLLVAALVAAATTATAQPASEPVEPGDVLQIEVYAGGEKQSD